MRLFEKVSLYQAEKDGLTEEEWSEIKFPVRSTLHSAGYDFFCPREIHINPGKTEVVPSGIRAVMNDDEVLFLYIRSSLGIKKNIRLSNSVGVTDADYSNADNEGHIHIALHNDSDKAVFIKRGERIMQGVFQKYLITDNDKTSEVRKGGIGSTGV